MSVSPTVCAKCEDKDMHLMNGYCVTCPWDKIFINNSCVCPNGTSEVDGRCQDLCKPGELTDPGNFCFICPYDQVIVKGKCECKTGFVRNFSGACELKKCNSNEYLINGRCGVCVLNTVYDAEKKICYCGEGYFLNKANVCEKISFDQINCTGNTYYDSRLRYCNTCPAACSKCTSQN